MSSPPPVPKVLDDDGRFHATDAEVDLSGTPPEAWAALGLFWLLGLTVFYQFATRYVLNDSAAWTEEIARYLLVGTVFVGAVVGVVKNNHIQVDLLYRWLPPRAGRVLSLAVDVLRIVFFGAMSVFTVQMMQKMQNYRMTVVDLPMNVVYGVCALGLAAMALRSVGVLRLHLRRGYSVLERPDSTLS